MFGHVVEGLILPEIIVALGFVINAIVVMIYYVLEVIVVAVDFGPSDGGLGPIQLIFVIFKGHEFLLQLIDVIVLLIDLDHSRIVDILIEIRLGVLR